VIDYKEMLMEMIRRSNEEELVRMIYRCERNVQTKTPLSLILRAEVTKRRREEGGPEGRTAA
jgi:hypothetical protein